MRDRTREGGREGGRKGGREEGREGVGEEGTEVKGKGRRAGEREILREKRSVGGKSAHSPCAKITTTKSGLK